MLFIIQYLIIPNIIISEIRRMNKDFLKIKWIGDFLNITTIK
jgi:hypothetical protein